MGASSLDEDVKLRAAIVCSDIGQPEPEPEPSEAISPAMGSAGDRVLIAPDTQGMQILGFVPTVKQCCF